MTQPIETLTQQLIHRATDPFSLALLTGVVSSSFSFFGATGLALNGVVAATITQSERAKKGISDASALKLWEWAFHRGKKRFAPAALLSGTSYLIASAFRPSLRPILYGASFLSLSIIPYTLAVVMPINKDILKTASDASKDGAKGPDPALVDKLFGEWRKYGFIRMSIAAFAWSLGTSALLLA